MSRILYIDAPFGISGDMLAAALIDLGASYERVQEALVSLPISGFATEVSRVKKAGLDMCDFLVRLDGDHENHDHDMTYLHGHEDSHAHVHEHHHEHEHADEHHHEHHHEHADEHHHEHHHEHAHEHHHGHNHEHHHHHEHRGMLEIREILSGSNLSDAARAVALMIFDVLAGAEAEAHGTTVDQVHFHEVGAVDSIVDIVTIAVCLEDLKLDGVVVGSLTDGCGTIRCQHGIMAVPVPAVTNIAIRNNLKLKISSVEGELVTPTGAAAAAAIRTADSLPASYRIVGSGMGAGKRQYSVPSFLRLLLLEAEPQEGEDGLSDTVVCLETNIDDSNGEALGLVMDRLMDAGAKDVYFTPIFMKKNRPAYMLGVICSLADADGLERLIFQHTSSIGIRRHVCSRRIMERESREASIDGISVRAKLCSYGDIKKCYPEYSSIRLLQEKKGLDYLTAYELIRMYTMNDKNVI